MTDRCIDGRLFRHRPFPDDPYFEHDVGECPTCGGTGCPREDASEECTQASDALDMEDLGRTVTMLRTYGPEIFGPPNEQGRVHFGQAVMDSAADAMERLLRYVVGLEDALCPLAALKVPDRPQGNAGAYSIRFADIERAAALLKARSA